MDDIIDKYNRTATEYTKSRIGREDRYRLNQFAGLLKPQAKVLDIGCAAGRDTRILKDIGLDVIGIDLADKLLDIARSSNPDIKFLLADMRNLPFVDKTFDAIWASAVLHHVNKNEMDQVMTEFNRVLSVGGVAFIHTKAGKGELITKEATVLYEERDFTLLTSEELDKIMNNAGFSRISLEESESRSRKGLIWISGLYRKDH